jgi:hypothetical protein
MIDNSAFIRKYLTVIEVNKIRTIICTGMKLDIKELEEAYAGKKELV